MTPPKVEGAAKPTSSVMISRMFGAPFGGTTRAGQPGLDCAAFSSICAVERLGRRRQVAAVDRRGRVGRTRRPVDLLRLGCAFGQAEGQNQRETEARERRHLLSRRIFIGPCWNASHGVLPKN